jgi:hypothetical protein
MGDKAPRDKAKQKKIADKKSDSSRRTPPQDVPGVTRFALER